MMAFYIIYFSFKPYVVGTLKNCLNEAILMSTNNTGLHFMILDLYIFYFKIILLPHICSSLYPIFFFFFARA